MSLPLARLNYQPAALLDREWSQRQLATLAKSLWYSYFLMKRVGDWHFTESTVAWYEYNELA
jgi:hypothetical protein